MGKKAVHYVIFTFLITWGLWWTLAYLSNKGITTYGQPVFMILFILGGNGPLIGALIAEKKAKNKEGFSDFIRRFFKFKSNPIWYLYIILVPFVVSFIPWAIIFFSKGAVLPLFQTNLVAVFIAIPIMILLGGLEEVGWRGVLLPQMLDKYSKVTATFIVGLIWGLWHLPLWFIEGTSQQNSNFLLFTITAISLSFLFTVLYTRTESIFLSVLMHSFVNSYGNNLIYPNDLPIVKALIVFFFSILVFFLFEKISLHKKTLHTDQIQN